MLEIVLFFFVFLPILSLVRSSEKIPRILKVALSLGLFTAICVGMRLNLDNNPNNFYTLLNVEKNCSKSELKKAYFKLSKIYHPDKNPDEDTTDKFMEIKTAYEIMSDDFFKARYDAFMQTKFDQETAFRAQLKTAHKDMTKEEQE
mmetsp:Transcript_19684/g.14132  ORF Transcript_19684/g.14132 Transcript_19684/m.14132 type:complete len:146 (+) Transcript_19684:20-457(+)